jgi:hypothetical protein
MLFSGFFVAPDLIPTWLRWAQYLCTLTYAVRILLVEEFDGNCGSDSDAIGNCQSLLNDVNANPDETWWNWLVLVGLFGEWSYIRKRNVLEVHSWWGAPMKFSPFSFIHSQLYSVFWRSSFFDVKPPSSSSRVQQGTTCCVQS